MCLIIFMYDLLFTEVYCIHYWNCLLTNNKLILDPNKHMWCFIIYTFLHHWFRSSDLILTVKRSVRIALQTVYHDTYNIHFVSMKRLFLSSWRLITVILPKPDRTERHVRFQNVFQENHMLILCHFILGDVM